MASNQILQKKSELNLKRRNPVFLPGKQPDPDRLDWIRI